MVALTLSEDMACPKCGGPIEVCTDPKSEGRWDVPHPLRCYKTAALHRRQDDYLKGNPQQPQSLLWNANRKD